MATNWAPENWMVEPIPQVKNVRKKIVLLRRFPATRLPKGIDATVLVIHLLRHYSKFARIVTSLDRTLNHAQLQQALNYIHTHLDQDLSLVQIAEFINISPTYFASLFKRATGISPHQYVIQQRVKRAKLLNNENGFGDRGHCIKSGFLQSKPFESTV